jgi:hypothetical protein
VLRVLLLRDVTPVGLIPIRVLWQDVLPGELRFWPPQPRLVEQREPNFQEEAGVGSASQLFAPAQLAETRLVSSLPRPPEADLV